MVDLLIVAVDNDLGEPDDVDQETDQGAGIVGPQCRPRPAAVAFGSAADLWWMFGSFA